MRPKRKLASTARMSRYSRELENPWWVTRTPVLVRDALSRSVSKMSDPENASTSVGEKMNSDPT